MFLRLASTTSSSAARRPPAALLRGFSDDRSGSVAVIFALMFVTLALFVGAAVDLGRWQAARSQTLSAMDAAVLAGGRVLQIDEHDVEGARLAAQRYYMENTKDRVPVVEDTIAFDVVDDNTGFAATGNAYLPTTFLGFAHIKRLPLFSASEAQFSKSQIKAGGKSNTDVEISMMLDVTGSMKDSKKTKKISALKTAAVGLVNTTISDSASANFVRIALVPFAEGVRLPSTANAAARGTPAAKVTLTTQERTKVGRNYQWVDVNTDYYPTECVVERAGADKYTDAAPGNGNYVMTLFNNSNVRTVNGKKYGTCGLSAADELVPLTNNKELLNEKIEGLELSGSTAGQIGTAWAWYTLSPNWNSLWSAESAAKGYGDGTRKIAILMTDGEYNLEYSKDGISTGTGGAGSAVNGSSTTQARSLCTAMKAAGITVYTVGFALDTDTAIETMNQCATDPSKAYTPADASELQQAFRDIALKINELYLTQ
jgi:Flp pilus assembly protein TadG